MGKPLRFTLSVPQIHWVLGQCRANRGEMADSVFAVCQGVLTSHRRRSRALREGGNPVPTSGKLATSRPATTSDKAPDPQGQE